MEIMQKISNHLIQETKLYRKTRNIIIFMTLFFFLTLFWSSEETELDKNLAAFSWISAILLFFFIWLYYAPLIVLNISNLKETFFYNEIYNNLYYNYINWLKLFQINLHTKGSLLKLTYIISWIFFWLAFVYLICKTMPFGNCINTAITIFFATIVIFLNISSYYICIVFVLFLSKLSKIDNLKYIIELPSVTYGFQLIKNTSDIIFLYFLFDSLLSTVICYIFWHITGMIPSSFIISWSNIPFGYIFFFLIIGTLLMWLIICLLSKAYLYRLHNKWKLASAKKLQEKYDNAINDAQKQIIIAMKEKVCNDKISIGFWNVALSLVSFLANIITLISIFR